MNEVASVSSTRATSGDSTAAVSTSGAERSSARTSTSLPWTDHRSRSSPPPVATQDTSDNAVLSASNPNRAEIPIQRKPRARSVSSYSFLCGSNKQCFQVYLT